MYGRDPKGGGMYEICQLERRAKGGLASGGQRRHTMKCGLGGLRCSEHAAPLHSSGNGETVARKGGGAHSWAQKRGSGWEAQAKLWG